jgi:hypothetical protein
MKTDFRERGCEDERWVGLNHGPELGSHISSVKPFEFYLQIHKKCYCKLQIKIYSQCSVQNSHQNLNIYLTRWKTKTNRKESDTHSKVRST